MKNNIIVAVVGMCGSGKSEILPYFLERNYTRVYFGDVTFNEMKRRNLPINPENERMIREEFRKTGDIAIYAKMLAPDIEEAYKKGNVVLESMYAWSEFKYLKEIYKENFYVVAVVTNKSIRESRLVNREFRPLTKQQVDTRDYSEIEKLEKGGPIGIADFYVINNGDKEALKPQMEQIFKVLEGK